MIKREVGGDVRGLIRIEKRWDLFAGVVEWLV